MLEILLETARRANENVLIEGVHGIGKSLRVKEYAKKNNLHLEILYLSHQEVGDLIGIPTISNNTTIWTKPSWLTRMEEANKKGQGCILFLDELNRAQRDVRQIALQITLEKRLHDHILPSIDEIETLVIAAINPEDDKKIDYQVDELDAALKVFDFVSTCYLLYPYLGSIAVDCEKDDEVFVALSEKYGNPYEDSIKNNAVFWVMTYELALESHNERMEVIEGEFGN